MQLRIRNNNIISEQGKPEHDLPVKRAAPHQQREKQDAKDDGEPEAKRLALSQHGDHLSSGTIVESVCKELVDKTVDSVSDHTLENLPPVERDVVADVVNDVIDDMATVLEVVDAVVDEISVMDDIVDPCPDYDYDVENKKDEFAVPDFAFDIIEYSKSREASFKVGDYMSRHTKLSKKIRARIVQFLVESQQGLGLLHETFYLAVKLLDLYFERRKEPEVEHKEIYLLVASCIYVAAKFEEPQKEPVFIDDLLQLIDETDDHNPETLMEMTADLMETINYDVGAPISYSFVRRFAKVYKTDMNTLTLARYILETSLMFYEFVGASESKIAAGAFLLAVRMMENNPKVEWTRAMHKYSGYARWEVEPWVSELNHMMNAQKAGVMDTPKFKLDAIFAKYSNVAYFKVAKVPLLPDEYAANRPLFCPN